MAKDGLKSISPACLDRYTAALNKAKEWHPELAVFGQETCYFGMAVVHNLQVLPHYDSGDDSKGFVSMTNFGDFEGADLVLGGGEFMSSSIHISPC